MIDTIPARFSNLGPAMSFRLIRLLAAAPVFLLSVALLVSPPSQVGAAERDHDGQDVFADQIAPLLSQHCLECHDSASRKGGLDLSRKSAVIVGGDSGALIVAGNAGESLLWQSIEFDQMPHDREPLSDAQKAVVKSWINGGAEWTVDVVDPSIYRDTRAPQKWVQRLTVDEYIATVASAVGVDIADQARAILPPDQRADGFANTAYNLNVDFGHVEAYSKMADLIVERMDVVAFAKPYDKDRTMTDKNMRALIEKMGPRILRGPLGGEEVALYRGVSTTVAASGGDYRDAVAYVIRAMLQSPRFLYRIENQAADSGAVTGYELASRISYVMWGAPPDDVLYQAAKRGDLSDPKKRAKQVQRMESDPRAVDRSVDFVSQWLDLNRLSNMKPDAERFPDWSDSIAADMRSETIAFFKDLVWQQRRPMSDLIDAQFTYATPQLARHYGIEPAGDSMQRYDLSSVPSRGGLLTQGSVLTIGGDDASMVTRGLFVLRDLLFSEVGDPPPGLDVTPVPTRPGRTHRTVATERIQSEACGGCHKRFEPLAFGLERFDGLGSYHQTDSYGNELREDGEILFPGQAEPVAYKTSGEMMELLSSSDRVAQCLTRKVIQFSIGRPLVAADAATVDQIHAAADKSGGTYQAIIRELLQSDLVLK